MDTAKIFPVALIVNIYHIFWLFITVYGFPFFVLTAIMYGLAMNSVRDRSRLLILVYPAYIIDFIGFSYLNLFYSQFFLIIVPLLILIILQTYLLMLSRNELKLFGRTVLSLSQTDRKLARKALKTKKVDDIAAVAQYTRWTGL